MRGICLAAVALFLVLPALASEPGQPLDCSDWGIDEPGITCSVMVPDCGSEPTTGNRDFPCLHVAGSGFDAVGNLVGIEYLEPGPPLFGYNYGHSRLELTSLDGIGERFWQVRKKHSHFIRRLQILFFAVIPRSPRITERSSLLNTYPGLMGFKVRFFKKPDVIGSNDGK